MTEEAKLIFTKYGLCIQFQTLEKKNTFLTDMKEKGIDFFTEEPGNHAYVMAYSEDMPIGWFLSEHQRLGLVFPSERLKFLFKEKIGLRSDCMMDMGPGYETQLHFSTDVFPPIDGASIIAWK